MQRRQFIKLSGTVFATASLPGVISGCLHHKDKKKTERPNRFRQGVASGDPRSESVAIWTRVSPQTEKNEPVFVTAQVSTSKDFENLVLEEVFKVTDESDYTLNIIVQQLQASTIYYYRFFAGNFEVGDISITGRTLTAPLSTENKEINFAFVSCQERGHSFYGAYRQMINDDIALPADKQLQFVLHLGDFIYETINEENHQPPPRVGVPSGTPLLSQAGEPRVIDSFPNGGKTDQGISFANSLEDYRHLYKQYLQDPDLQAARARWPFIHIWDDHEFSDDCWQTEANYHDSGNNGSTDEPSQLRKLAANQAWVEYLPVNLTQINDTDVDLRHATPFQAPDKVIELSPNDKANFDNTVAIESLTIYRSFRFGQNLDLLCTDNRSYRSDHAVPEEISGNSDDFFNSRMLLPLDLVNELDLGKEANNGLPSPTVSIPSGTVNNPRVNQTSGSILGDKQKLWWQKTMDRSNATWRFWGNSVPLMRFLIDLNTLDNNLSDLLLSADTWDGYASERNELMKFLVDRKISNVISLAGDIHAHVAGNVLDDYDKVGPAAKAVAAVEFVCAPVSSISMFSAVERLSRRDTPTTLESQIRDLIAYGIDDPVVSNINNTLLNGSVSGAFSAINSSLPDPVPVGQGNPHLDHVDTHAHGYGLISVSSSEVKASLITINDQLDDQGVNSPGIKTQIDYTVAAVNNGDPNVLVRTALTGDKPFPLV